MLLFTGQLTNEPETVSVKELAHNVCLNHWYNIKCTPYQDSELSTTQ